MRLASFSRRGERILGVEVPGGFVDVTARMPGASSLDDFVQGGQLDRLRPFAELGADFGTEEVTYLPPLERAGKIFCIGLNYDEHRIEGDHPEVAYPTVFTRFNDSHVGHLTPLVKPGETAQFDYEGELAVVIGKSGRRISVEDAMGHVAGYSVYNDATARDWQVHSSQWGPGKNFADSGSFGPSLVTADEILDITASELTTRVNNVLVQRATIADMIFGIPELIAYLSTFGPLRAGDVIVSGTPSGVGVSRTPQLLLRDGDVVEVSVSEIGTLQNTVREELRAGTDSETEK